MRQPITSLHVQDSNANPAGGHTEAVGIRVDWQNGPLVVDGERVEPNGAFVETVLAVALDRLNYYQSSKFHCPENAAAIAAIEVALDALDARTKDRQARGVEGTHGL